MERMRSSVRKAGPGQTSQRAASGSCLSDDVDDVLLTCWRVWYFCVESEKNRMRRPILPWSGIPELGSFHPDVNAGVTNSHLKQRMLELRLLQAATGHASVVGGPGKKVELPSKTTKPEK